MLETEAVVMNSGDLVWSAFSWMHRSWGRATVPIDQDTLAFVNVRANRRVARCRSRHRALLYFVNGIANELLKTRNAMCKIS